MNGIRSVLLALLRLQTYEQLNLFQRATRRSAELRPAALTRHPVLTRVVLVFFVSIRE
jgi:hypothetical protein